MALDLSYSPSWFNRINYKVQAKLDEFLDNDPVAQLFTDRTDDNRSTTFDLTGRANSGFANFTVPGQKANSTLPVEEDQMSKSFVSVKERQVFQWETFLHDKFNYITDTSAELAKKVMNSFHLLLTHQLHNFATATSVTLPGGISYDLTTPDTLALISASHTVPGTGATTYTNIGGTDALSEEALTNAILVGQENMVDSSGTSIPFNPDMIIVPNVEPLVKKAFQITGSDQVESTGNNAINKYGPDGIQVYGGGRMKVMVLNFAPLLAGGGRDTTTAKWAWSIADSSMLKKILHFKWAVDGKPKSYGKFMDEENGDSAFLVMGRVAVGASRWQGIVRNNATSAPTDSSAV